MCGVRSGPPTQYWRLAAFLMAGWTENRSSTRWSKSASYAMPQVSQWKRTGSRARDPDSSFGTRQVGHMSSQRSSSRPVRVACRNILSTSNRSAPHTSASANGRMPTS